MSLTPTSQPENNAYDVSTQWNLLVAKVNALINIQMLESTPGDGYITILENQDHATIVHNIGALPKGVVFGDLGEDAGRSWYDKDTITVNQIDIYVANPPIGGVYHIPVFYYY